jgi:ATP-binding protein
MGVKVGTLTVGRRTRRQRRAANRAEKQLFHEISEQKKASKQRQKKAEDALLKGESLPAAGEIGDRMGRSVLPAYPTLTRISTKKARVQFPFLIPAGRGGDGVLIGTDKFSRSAFCFDPFVDYRKGLLSNTNMAVIGTIGTGKSSLMKCMALRDLVFGRRTFVPGDPKGEWTGVVQAVGGAAITLGGTSRARLNPLDAGRRPERDRENGQPVDDAQWRIMVDNQRLDLLEALVSTLMKKDLSQSEKAALRVGLEAASARHGGSPIIPTVAEEIFNPSTPVESLEGFRDRQDLINIGREVGFALQELTRGKLRGLFDGPSTIGFDPAAPMMSINLKNFSQGSLAMSLVMACTGSWFEASLRGDDLGQRNVIYEEAHELMSFPQLLERMRSNFKLVRAWGLRNIIALHRISDLDAVGSLGSKQRSVAEGLLSDTSTRVVYRQESDQLENTQRVLGLSDSSLNAVENLSIGSGLWQVGKQPYLVAHRRTEWEKTMTNTDSELGERQ